MARSEKPEETPTYEAAREELTAIVRQLERFHRERRFSGHETRTRPDHGVGVVKIPLDDFVAIHVAHLDRYVLAIDMTTDDFLIPARVLLSRGDPALQNEVA